MQAFVFRVFVFLLLPLGSLSAQEKPNILMIISDDQAWGDYGFMGHPRIETPRLDRLAKESVVFRRGYVPTSLCRPSLMTMITGRYAHQHQITGNDPSTKHAKKGSERYQKQRADLIANIDRFETLPKALAKQGYVSFQSGKWWEGNFKRGGFSDGMTRGFPEPGGRHGDDGLKIGRNGLQPVTQFMAKAVADRKPFLVWYAPFLPHSPHTPPKRLEEKYLAMKLTPAVARYEAMCEWFDETCGELLDELDRLEVADHTIVIYACDNGWIQNPDKPNRYAALSKQTPYEGGVRTPIMFRWPKQWKPGDRRELASTIDLAPTLLAAAGAETPPDLPGLNLGPAMAGGTPIERDSIFGEGFAHDIADLDDPEASLLYRWCIEGKWKLILTYDGEVNRYASTHLRDAGPYQLFDLMADPGETRNLAEQHPDVVAKLKGKIDAWYPVKSRKLVQ